ncbi:MAG: NTP transferase domain-containing protein [Rhodospirillales bacterium]
MSVTALIAARMGSSRFAGKSLADLHGKPMLSRMVERVRRAARVEGVVLATTILPEDDALQDWADAEGVQCFRGSADDVLGRLRAAAERFEMDTIVEMLGDNPLVHASMIDAALDLYEDANPDYVATVTNEYPLAAAELKRFPIGVRVQVFSIETLRRCEERAKTAENREHATSFIASHPEMFETTYVEASGPFAVLNRPELTFAVNFPENLDLIRGVFAECYASGRDFGIEQAIEAVDNDPALMALMGEHGRND